MKSENKIEIPENHKRSLSVTSQHIENSIEEIEEMLNKKDEKYLTKKVFRNIDEGTKQKILELTAILREQNKKMFEALNLFPNEYFEDRIVRSRISFIWTMLYDSMPEKMRGYGKLKDDEKEAIKVHIDKLLEIIEELRVLLDKIKE